MTDRPLRVLMGADVPPDPNSGAAGTVFQMGEALRRQGHVVDSFWSDELPRHVRHGNLHYLLELPRAFRQAVRRANAKAAYDVIELNQPHAYLAARDHQVSRRAGVFINRSHGHEVRSDIVLDRYRSSLGMSRRTVVPRLLSAVVRRGIWRQWHMIAHEADGFIVSCKQDADFLGGEYGVESDRIGIITQGVPDAFLESPVASLSEDRLRRILYVGQMAFVKAPMILLQAIHALLTTIPELSFSWVCSEVHHSDILSQFPRQLHNRIHLVPHLNQDELINVYDHHGIFVFPSFFEGFGKAPLEAMARGLCVVATDVGGMRDYITSRSNGLLVAPGNSSAIVPAVQRLLQNHDKAQQMAKKAHETAIEHTWDRCAQDAIAFYRQVIERKNPQMRQVGTT